jgi:hypothetical protein
MKDLVKRLRKMLLVYQWGHDNHDGDTYGGFCPSCSNPEFVGHEASCEMNNLLTEAEIMLDKSDKED